MADAAPFPFAGEASAVASSMLWACAGIVFRRMKGRVPAAAVNLTKNTTAAVAFTLLALILTQRPWPTSMPMAAQGWLALSGFVGLTLCDTFLLRAMMELGPRRAMLLMLLAPVLIFAGAMLPPFGETSALARPLTIVGAVLALVGIALAAAEVPDAALDPEDSARKRRGLIDGVIAAVLQAAGVLLARRGLSIGAGPVEGAHVRLVAGSLGLVLGGVLWRQWPEWKRSLAAPGLLRTLALAGFFGTFLGIGLNQCAIAWASSTGVAATVNSLAPVWLIPLSTVFLGERHGARAWISTALALGGVALLSL
jgi:drug/metabolite transporter (DMT)-like permease